MNNFPRKVNIKSARVGLTPMDLSYDYYGTTEFFRLQPIMSRIMVPGDRFKVDVESFVRLAPLAVPTFGRMKLHTRAFFVPCRTIMRGWNEFITQSPYTYTEINDGSLISSQEIISSVPTFENATILNLFANVAGYATSTTASVFDFQIGSTKYVFTSKGRFCYSLLNSLGYGINFSTDDATKFNALKLISFYKVYYDWYRNTNFDNESSFEKLFNCIDNNLGVSELTPILDVIYTNYERDFFNSVWKNPIGPNSTVNPSSPIKFVDPTVNGSSSYKSDITTTPVSATENGTPVIVRDGGTNGYPFNLSQYAIDALKKLTDFMKRNQLSGFRPLERFLTRYGVKLDNSQVNRSVFIGASDFDVQISDVTSTADTEYAPIGENVGKGIGYGNSNTFDFEANEFGYFVILQSLIPHVGFCQGRDRENLDITALDFFQPEFDNLGVQAVRNDELFADFKTTASFTAGNAHGGRPTGIFGYAPRYSHLKTAPKDILSGDFRIDSLQAEDLKAYLLLRFLPTPSASTPLVLDPQFSIGENSQYDRIFANSTNTADHFYLINHLKVSAMRPMRSIVDSVDLDGGRDVTIDYEGMQMN